MLEHYLSNTLIVKGVKGRILSETAEMPPKEAREFIEAVKDAYKKLKRLKTGAALLNAISVTGKTCTIFCTDQSGTALSNPPDLSNNLNRMVKSFRPQRHNMLTMNAKVQMVRPDEKVPDGAKVLPPAPNNNPAPPNPKPVNQLIAIEGKAVGKMKQHIKELGRHERKFIASMELDYVLLRVWRDVNKGRTSLAQLLGKSRAQIDRMCDGADKIEDSDYYKICFAYYEYLTPGPGCNSQVKLLPEIRLDNPKHEKEPKKYPYNPKKDADCVAPEIMLGHELIHAWRMMAGRRIVNDGWEEEAMTTGIPPFAHLKFTENALRRDAGYPTRQRYELRVFNSKFAEGIYNS